MWAEIARQAIKYSLKYLDRLPDSLRLAANLTVIGGAVLGGAWWQGNQDAAFHGSALQRFISVAGGIALFSGLFIFFRRGVWNWQEKRDKNYILKMDIRK